MNLGKLLLWYLCRFSFTWTHVVSQKSQETRWQGEGHSWLLKVPGTLNVDHVYTMTTHQTIFFYNLPWSNIANGKKWRPSSCHVFPCQFWCLIERRRMTGGFFGVAASVNFHIDPLKGTDYIYIYVHIYIFLYAYMHACMYIYIYIYSLPLKAHLSRWSSFFPFYGMCICFRKRVTSLSNNTNTCTPKWNCSSRFLKLSSGRGFGETRFPSTKRFLFWKKRPTSNTFFKHSGHSFD